MALMVLSCDVPQTRMNIGENTIFHTAGRIPLVPFHSIWVDLIPSKLLIINEFTTFGS
jgi:hypothetical protein